MNSQWLPVAALAFGLALPGMAMAQQDRTTRPNQAAPMAAPNQAGERAEARENRSEMRAETRKGSGWQASELIGLNIRGPNNDNIGDIDDLVVNDQGRVTAALVDVGGFLGIGSRTVAIDFEQIRIDTAQKAGVVRMNKDQLSQLPEWDDNRQQADRPPATRPAAPPAPPPAGTTR